MADDILSGGSDTISGSGSLSQNTILDALDDDLSNDDVVDDSLDEQTLDDSTEEETESDDEVKEEKEKTDEEDELDDDNIKLEDKDDLEFEEVPNRQSILKAYPNLFKKFPGIERAIYREDQYTKIFPSIKEAELARERLGVLSAVEGQIFNGDIGTLLSTVKQNDPKAFGKISGNILETIQKVDKEAHFNIINTVVKRLIKSTFDSGKKMGGEDGEQLQIAARLLNRSIYNTAEITEVEQPKVQEEENPREKELTAREQRFYQEQQNIAVNDVSSRIRGTIKSAVQKYIDPRNLMGDYVKDKAINDVISAVDKEIGTDHRFKSHLDRLWAEAAKSGYSDESKARIREAVIKKAKGILPGYIKNVRASALKGVNGSRKAKSKDDETVLRRPASQASSRSSNNSSRSSNKSEAPKRVGSVNDIMKFLNS